MWIILTELAITKKWVLFPKIKAVRQFQKPWNTLMTIGVLHKSPKVLAMRKLKRNIWNVRNISKMFMTQKLDICGQNLAMEISERNLIRLTHMDKVLLKEMLGITDFMFRKI